MSRPNLGWPRNHSRKFGRRSAVHTDSAGSEAGNAVIEFIFVAVVVMVPLVYLIVAVAVVQRAQLAVANAAREAGRAFATAATADQGLARAAAAAQIAFTDAGLPEHPVVRFVAVDQSCTDTAIVPTLVPGAEFLVCVRRQTEVPAIPTVLQGGGITSEGRFRLHIDDYRAA